MFRGGTHKVERVVANCRVRRENRGIIGAVDLVAAAVVYLYLCLYRRRRSFAGSFSSWAGLAAGPCRERFRLAGCWEQDER